MSKYTLGEWEELNTVKIDTGMLLLVDPCRADCGMDIPPCSPDDTLTDQNQESVIVPTGLGDGNYLVEGRFMDCGRAGTRLAEIRVRFLDENGTMLSYRPEPAHAPSDN